MGVGDLNTQLMRLARVLQALRQHASTHAPGGVPWATYSLLFHLVVDGPRRSGELAQCVHADASTVSRQVDQLVRMGLVERRADPRDGRATQLVATEAGRQLHARVRADRERMLADVLAHWPAEDLDRLTALLGALVDDLTAALPRMLQVIATDSVAATAHLTGDRR